MWSASFTLNEAPGQVFVILYTCTEDLLPSR
jgi:hypothetical protein